MLTVNPVLSSTPLLAFIGRILLTTTGSSATSHRHHALSFLLDIRHLLTVSLGVRLPQLLHWLPVDNATLKHTIELIEYWTLHYFARVSLNSAGSGSLALCTVYFLSLPSDHTVSQ